MGENRTEGEGEGGFRFARICLGERERILLDCWGFRLVVERRPVPKSGHVEIVLLNDGFSPIPTPPPDTELVLGALPCQLQDETATGSVSTDLENEIPIFVADEECPDDTAVDSQIARTA